MRPLLLTLVCLACDDPGGSTTTDVSDATSADVATDAAPSETDAASPETDAASPETDAPSPETDAPSPETTDTDVAETTDTSVTETTPDVIDPTVALLVELTWTSPGSPTGLGADLDLHVLHPAAEGEFFDGVYDVNWLNRSPEWGEPGIEDNPELLADSVDGAGPELVEINQPGVSLRYCIGVHHYDYGSHGEASATIRIFSNGVPFHEASRSLALEDLWEATCVTWGGTVESSTIEDVDRVTPDVGGAF